jgi:hypothetical protein
LLTGYKLRKHIGNALRTRSQAVRNSLEHYNAATATVNPPRPPLSWNDIVKYAFLSEFDLLRDSRQDICERPWSRPACRVAMDQHFKILRAHEEILRLNIEIRRVITYMRDEDAFLLKKECDLRDVDPILANQVALRREDRGRFNELHLKWFRKLSTHPGFTGSIIPGVSRDAAIEVTVDRVGGLQEVEGMRDQITPQPVDAGMVDGRRTSEGHAEDDDDDEDQEDRELASLLYSVLSISTD